MVVYSGGVGRERYTAGIKKIKIKNKMDEGNHWEIYMDTRPPVGLSLIF